MGRPPGAYNVIKYISTDTMKLLPTFCMCRHADYTELNKYTALVTTAGMNAAAAQKLSTARLDHMQAPAARSVSLLASAPPELRNCLHLM